jgi:hypothetical protein
MTDFISAKKLKLWMNLIRERVNLAIGIVKRSKIAQLENLQFEGCRN